MESEGAAVSSTNLSNQRQTQQSTLQPLAVQVPISQRSSPARLIASESTPASVEAPPKPTNASIFPSLRCDLSLLPFTTSDDIFASSSDRRLIPASASLSAGLKRAGTSSSALLDKSISLETIEGDTSASLGQEVGMEDEASAIIPNSEDEGEPIVAGPKKSNSGSGAPPEDPSTEYSLPAYITLARNVTSEASPRALALATETESSIRDFTAPNRPPTAAGAAQASSSSAVAASKSSSASDGVASFASREGQQGQRGPQRAKPRRISKEAQIAAQAALAEKDAQTSSSNGASEASLPQQSSASASADASKRGSGTKQVTEVSSSSPQVTTKTKKRARKDPLAAEDDAAVAQALSSIGRTLRGQQPNDAVSSGTKAAPAKNARKRAVIEDSDDDDLAIGLSAESKAKAAKGKKAVSDKASDGAKGKGKGRASTASMSRSVKAAQTYKSAEMVDSEDDEDVSAPVASSKGASSSSGTNKEQQPRTSSAANPAAEEGDEEDEVVVVQKKPPAKKPRRSTDSAVVRSSSPPRASTSNASKGLGTPAVGPQPFSLTERGSRSKTKTSGATPIGESSSAVGGRQEASDGMKGKKRKNAVESDEEEEEETPQSPVQPKQPVQQQAISSTKSSAAAKGKGKTKVVPQIKIPAQKGKKAKISAAMKEKVVDEAQEKEGTTECEGEEQARLSAESASRRQEKENKGPTPSPSPAKAAASAVAANTRKPAPTTTKHPEPPKPPAKRGLAATLAKLGHGGARPVGLVRERKHHLHAKINPSPRVQKRVPQKLTKKRGEYDSGEEDAKPDKERDDEDEDEREEGRKATQEEMEVEYFNA